MSAMEGKRWTMSCEIRIMGPKGSQSLREIVEGTGLRRYASKKYKTDVLVNYGLSGEKLRNFYRRFPSAKGMPTINRIVGYSKYRALQLAKRHGIIVPESRLELLKSHKLNDWIEKRFNSQSGYGICQARGRHKLSSKYYQRYIKDRRYELRIHGFNWVDQKNWKVQKRFGKDGEIAWNYRNGGYFSSVYNPTNHQTFVSAMEITSNVLRILNMGFGAADFIVSRDGKLYFIEVNSCPGFQELSKNIYLDAFESLRKMRLKEVLKFAD